MTHVWIVERHDYNDDEGGVCGVFATKELADRLASKESGVPVGEDENGNFYRDDATFGYEVSIWPIQTENEDATGS